MNKALINFPMILDVSNYVESEFSPKKFNFMGSVNRNDINGKEHYISFQKDLNSNNWFCSDSNIYSKVLLYSSSLLIKLSIFFC